MLSYKSFLQRQPPFYNQHGKHGQTPPELTESIDAIKDTGPDIYEEHVAHPHNQKRHDILYDHGGNLSTVEGKTERAFKDFSTPPYEITDTQFEEGSPESDEDYTHLTSRGINSALIHRATNGLHSIPGIKHTADQHNQALERATLISNEINRTAPLHRDATVWSGRSYDPRAHHDSDGIIHSHGFLSTSSHPSMASDFAEGEEKHIMKIYVPKGHKILPMGLAHSHTADESEMLLDKGIKMKYSHSEQHEGYQIHHYHLI